jgi:site-specific DNA recombinase
MTMKTVIYARVSKDDMNLQRQFEDIQKHCVYRGLTVVNQFTEKISGLKEDRCEINNLISFCKIKTNDIKFVVVSELSRLGRTKQIIDTVDQLTKLGICLISLKERIETLNDNGETNPTTNMIISIMSSINQFEVETIKYRVKSGLKSSAFNGNAGGGRFLPYGYKKDGKKLIIDETESEMIKYIFHLYLNGNGTSKISRIFNQNDYKTRSGKKWHDKVIYDIITNSIYCGERNFKNEIIDSPQLKIIDKKTFDKCQEIRVGKHCFVGINEKFDYKLERGKIICGCCGKTYFTHKRESGKDNAYKCISIRYKENCGNVGINIDKLDRSLMNIIKERYFDKITLNVNTTEIDNKISYSNTLIAKLGELQKKNKFEEKKLIDIKVTFEYMSNDIFKEKMDQILTERKRIINEIETESNHLMEYHKIRISSKNIDLLKNHINENGISKDILNKIITRITIFPSDKVISTWKNDTISKIILEIAGDQITYYLSRYTSNIFIEEQLEQESSMVC